MTDGNIHFIIDKSLFAVLYKELGVEWDTKKIKK